MTRRILIGVATLTACLVLAAVTSATSQTRTDARGDSSSDVDLKKARADFDAGTLEFTVRTYGPLPRGVRPCIEIGTQFLIGCFGNFATDDQNGDTLFRVKTEKAASSITYTFKAKHLSAPPPPSIRWRAILQQDDRLRDTIPGKGFVKLSLAP
jgi:hypothetical protein